MSDKVLELKSVMTGDDIADGIVNLWVKYENQRSGKKAEWLEVQNYLSATDSRTTSNSDNPFDNTITVPKLTQIYDNLLSNYASHLFPNDNWLSWEAYSQDAATKRKSQTIEAYMANKTRMSHFEQTIKKVLSDYIEYGNCFVMPSFESRYNEYQGTKIAAYIGPVCERISPDSIVFNPTASSFENTFKIIRSVKSIGELLKLSQTQPEHAFWEKVIKRRRKLRTLIGGGLDGADNTQMSRYTADGFGSWQEYVGSEYIEVLDFYGDYYDDNKMELITDAHITVADRSMVARQQKIDTYSGRAPIRHVGWRNRRDNLWAMGPLDNLVGLQYAIDKLQNGYSDAMDSTLKPMFKNIGEVEDWQLGPSGQINIDEGGDVQELQRDLSSIVVARGNIQEIMELMELFAGAPREAMGVRSPGEKTLGEVQILDNAASRIFQEKINTFEKELMEPILNDMLEISTRNLDENDTIRVLDKDSGAIEFREITKDDITANGVIRPIGARHFSKQAQDLQNLNGILNGAIGQMIAPHTSSIQLAEWVESVTDLKAYKIFEPNIAIMEQKETQDLVQSAQDEIDVANQIDPEALSAELGEEEELQDGS